MSQQHQIGTKKAVYRKRLIRPAEYLFGECPDHGKSMECIDSRAKDNYRRRRYKCQVRACKYKSTTVEVVVPVKRGDYRHGSMSLNNFVRRVTMPVQQE